MGPIQLILAVLASACADGQVDRTPVAWNEAADQLLIHRVDRIGCGAHHAVEVWDVGADWASECYDLLGDPTVTVPCAELTDHYASGNLALTPLLIEDFVLPPGFLTRAQQSPHQVRISVGGADPIRKSPTVGEVEMELDGSWVPLYVGAVLQADQEPPDNSGPIPKPVTVTLWPSPDGRRAALFIHDNWSYPNWITTVEWVEHPQPTQPRSPPPEDNAAPSRSPPIRPGTLPCGDRRGSS